MPLRCVYTDLDGTLLGRGASLFHDGDGQFTLLAGRALEACHRAGVEVVPISGRRRGQVAEPARLIGATAYCFEIGGGLVVDGEESWLCGDFQPRDGQTPWELVEQSGAPALLLAAYADTLELHTPWDSGREVTHLFRGKVDVDEANALLGEHGDDDLRLLDNGAIGRPMPAIDGPTHAYHLVPRQVSKAAAVAAHARARGYDPADCIAVGDSVEDLEVAAAVGRFFVVANGPERDPGLRSMLASWNNATVTEGSMGDGFYEAVISTLVRR